MPVNVQFAAYIFVFSIQLTAKILSMELFELGPSGVGSDRFTFRLCPKHGPNWYNFYAQLAQVS